LFNFTNKKEKERIAAKKEGRRNDPSFTPDFLVSVFKKRQVLLKGS
jgi:hypothetical protein